MNTLGLILLVILFYIVTCGLCWFSEWKRWNHGYSKKNGLPWIYFDTDSQGGRGYIAGGHKEGSDCCWISWPFIDK